MIFSCGGNSNEFDSPLDPVPKNKTFQPALAKILELCWSGGYAAGLVYWIYVIFLYCKIIYSAQLVILLLLLFILILRGLYKKRNHFYNLKNSYRYFIFDINIDELFLPSCLQLKWVAKYFMCFKKFFFGKKSRMTTLPRLFFLLRDLVVISQQR